MDRYIYKAWNSITSSNSQETQRPYLIAFDLSVLKLLPYCLTFAHILLARERGIGMCLPDFIFSKDEDFLKNSTRRRKLKLKKASEQPKPPIYGFFD